MPDDLILQPTEPNRKRKHHGPKPVEDLSPTVRLEQAFQRDFEERYGFPMGNVLYKAPRDRRILKTLIADVGEDEARALVRDFFFRYDKDRWIRFMTRAGNVLDFKKCLDRLVVLRNGHQATESRTAENDAVIDRIRTRHR